MKNKQCKENYNYKEIAKDLGVEPDHVKNLIKLNCFPGAFDIRLKPQEPTDMRYIRVPKEDLQSFKRNRRLITLLNAENEAKSE